MLVLGALVVLATACERADAQLDDSFQGVIEFDEVRLGFEVGGRVVELDAVEGDDVKAGALLARLDDRVERATQSTRQSEVQAAQAQAELVKEGPRSEEVAALAARLRAAGIEVERLEREHARESKLLAEGATPRVVVDDLSSALARAKAERDAITQDLRRVRKGSRKQEISGAEARAQASEAALEVTDRRLELYSLSTPTQGHVLERHVEIGEVVAPGTPVFTLADVQRPYADVFVPQAKIARVSEGAEASVRIDALSEPLGGKVESIARTTEFTPRYLFSERERPNLVVRVRIRIDDPEHHAYAGVPAFVSIDGQQVSQAPARQ